MTAAFPSNRVHVDAVTAYLAARQRVDRQMRQIQALLHAHANKQMARPENRAFAGDLDHVAEVLDDAIEFLGGTRETGT